MSRHEKGPQSLFGIVIMQYGRKGWCAYSVPKQVVHYFKTPDAKLAAIRQSMRFKYNHEGSSIGLIEPGAISLDWNQFWRIK